MLDFLELPFELSEAQKWSVSGRGAGGELSGLWLEGAVTGSDPLTVELGKMPAFYLLNETEVGPVKIEGTSTTRAGHENGLVGFLGELNSEDGESVELSHVFFFGSGELGPLTTSDAELDVGAGLEPTGGLEAPSVTLDAGSTVTFEIVGKEAVPYVDYSQLSSEGTIDLANSTIGIEVDPPSEGKSCPELVTGQTYTFVSTTGALSGAFANAPEHGADIPITSAAGCKATSQEMRISYNESGGTQTVTATVETKPVVTESPASTKVTEGGSATFKAGATGASSVQWQVKKNGGAFENDTTDQGVTTNTLEVEDATGAESGDEYRAVFKNGAGEAPTVSAMLTVETLAEKKNGEEAAKKKEEERQNEEAIRKLGEEHLKLVAEEAARTAANKQQEEEAAAARKRHEEEAAKQGALGFKEGSPDATIASASLQASASGEVSVKVSCPAAVNSCAGTVTLRTLDAVAASAKAKPAILTLATGPFSVAGGQVKTIVLHLSSKARSLLARSHTLHVRVAIAAHNATGATHTGYVVGTLRAAKAKHGRG